MANPLGPLGPADERFDHQIADTFATVGASDPSWTEKVCAMAARRDGSLQLGFGMGKYTNRNVLDGYAGLSRGAEQITVRGSRRLFPDPDRPSVGPIRYEVLEPMKRVRFALDPNPLPAPGLRLGLRGGPAAGHRGAHPPAGPARLPGQRRPGPLPPDRDGLGLDRDRRRAPRDRPRRVGVDPRPLAGASATTWAPRPPTSTRSTRWPQMDFQMIWCPALMADPDGTRWGLFMHLVDVSGFGHHQRTVTGAIEHIDGRVERMADIRPDLAYDPSNRRLLGGTVTVTLEDGTERTFELEVPTRHRLPPGGRPLLRMAGPPPRRVAGRAPRRRGAPGGLPPARAGP